MPAIINADDGVISGASGLKLSSDTSGALNIQTNGVTAIAISASQAVSFPATTSLNFTSANITTLTSSSATITNLLATTLTVSSVGIFPAGSASSAAITTAGDTNTGIFFPAADTIAFTEGGVEAARFNSSGQLDLVNNPILTGGTANGVTYLNGSKALTSGSALTFDGTTLGVTSTWVLNSQLSTNATANNLSGISAKYNGVTRSYLYFDNSTNLYNLYGESGVSLAFTANGSEQMRLTQTGLGIGTTSPSQKLEVAGAAKLTGTNLAIVPSTTTQPAYVVNTNAGGNFFVGIDNSTGLSFGAGAYGRILYSGGAYPMVFFTNDTERARITSAGDLLVSTTTAITNVKFVVGGSISCQSTNGVIYFGNAGTPAGQANYGVNAAIGRSGGTNFHIAGSVEGDMCIAPEGTKSILFGTSGSANSTTERARITANGFFGVNDTAPGYRFVSSTSTQGVYAGQIKSTASTDSYVCNFKIATQTGGAGAYFLVCDDNANRLLIAGTGNVTNTNGSYGTISDAKMKTDIVDAGSQWADIKAVRFRKFKMKDDPSGLMQLGVVAQELEQTSPGLIEEHKDYEEVEVTDEEGNVKKERQPTGDTTKSVKTSVLLMKAAVALQEAMLRIEQLESKVSQLEVK